MRGWEYVPICDSMPGSCLIKETKGPPDILDLKTVDWTDQKFQIFFRPSCVQVMYRRSCCRGFQSSCCRADSHGSSAPSSTVCLVSCLAASLLLPHCSVTVAARCCQNFWKFSGSAASLSILTRLERSSGFGSPM